MKRVLMGVSGWPYDPVSTTPKIRTLLVDDDLPARKRIRRLLALENDIEMIGEIADPAEAAVFIRQHAPDLLFLGVQMPGLDGFSLLASLPPNSLPRVIFVTSSPQHAVRAFDARALDYLLKPLVRSRFRQALDRAREQIRRPGAPAMVVGDARVNPRPNGRGSHYTPASRILVRAEGRILLLRSGEIDWAEAADNYVRVHVGTESHLLRGTLGALELRLDPAKFLRIHRSTLVNIERVRELQPWFHGDYIIILQDGNRLNLSRTYRDRVIQQLGEIL